MNHDLKVSKSILISAPVGRVWEVLTKPEIIKEYLYGTNTITDWKPGSSIVFQGEYNGQTYRDHGEIIENSLHELISYSYWSGFSGLEDTPDNYSKISYLLETMNDNHTKLTWTQEGFSNEEGQKHSEAGMDDFLKQIRSIAEKD
ncbi:MAG: SRPBCC domain-containing protein [Saprospiraceae bacterium]|jgi:uncharacterized protein YndB with AHSA1/START domain|nr:SRPBCC domain-containing protein [Saprospiraceae bacterium]